MKGLGARLRRSLDAPHPTSSSAPHPLKEPPGPSGISAALARARRTQERVAATLDAQDPPPRLEDALPGSTLSTEAGPLYIVEERLPLTTRHGDLELGALFTQPVGHLRLLTGDERLADFDPRRALFIDIEATGLDHGAGTVAFLIGVGFFERDAFTLRQLVLRDHGEERALLLHLRELLERFPYLVSFNGKSYDLSVLQTRLVMHRLYSGPVAALKLKPHLDLLHLSRNLYRDIWANTRLGTLEAKLLGVTRVDDIPGHLVPACWLAWLRREDPRPLAGVALHNRLDVLSMVTLAERLAAVSLPEAAGRSPRIALNLGRVLYRRRAFEIAREVLTESCLRDAHWLRAACARRLGDPRGREDALRALLVEARGDAAALRELAIVLERRGALGPALAAASEAASGAPSQAADHRIARLRRRLQITTPAHPGVVAGD